MLKHILKNWLNKASKNDDVAKFNNLPKHAQVKLVLANSPLRTGNKKINPIKASGITLQSISPDIEALIAKIDEYTDKFNSETGLTSNDCFAEYRTVTLDQFFTDANQMYIPLSTIHIFMEKCDKLLAMIDESLEKGERRTEYSIRLLNKCLTSIQNVCRAVELAAQ